MPLRFRSVVPYTLPGVLALIGWWWYISRKKEQISSHDSEEEGAVAMGLLTSPTEGSNGLLEKASVSPTASTHQITGRDPPPIVKGKKAKTDPATVSCLGSAGTSVTQTPPSPPQSQEESSATSRLDREQESAGQSPPSAVALVTEPEQPELEEPSHPTAEAEVVLSHVLYAMVSATPLAAELANAERPEPEGEVSGKDAPSLSYSSSSTTLSTKDTLVCLPAQDQRTAPEEPHILETNTSSQGIQHTVMTSIQVPPAPVDSLLVQGPAQENGTGGAELELMAAGLITDVITAATAQVLSVTCCQDTDQSDSEMTKPGSSSTPLANGKPCSEQEPIRRDSWPSPIGIESKGEGSANQEEEAVPNGCLSAPVWEPINGQRGRATENAQNSHCPSTSLETQDPALASLDKQEEEGECLGPRVSGGVVESAVVMVTSLAGEHSLGAMCEMKRLSCVGLRNGAHGASEAETDQSGVLCKDGRTSYNTSGSDVNSMDSVDSGCTMGAGDSQNSSSLTPAANSELIVWEIEVPKHLVGRLIGKQGRYVSFLKQSSGAKIYISTLPYTQEFQICHIEGTQQQVDKALSLIGKKFKDLDLTNLYAPPSLPLTLPSLPMTSWLLLPSGVTVEVIVVNIVSAGHMFVQQHTHPTFHVLRSLDQQMFLCYSQPGTPALPSPAEVGLICAAPAVEGAWWRAQVISFFKETSEVEIRYVDYGGYDRVKIDTLRQIRSDFVTLPFQGAEVLLDNIAPLPGEDRFSTEASTALEEMTRGVALLAQVTNYDNNTGVPLVQMWNMVGDELVSVNRSLAERGLGTWVDSF
ncbi:A kinase (PRKA) anchor protein 1b [Osmerus mordax]|uniref:A kinase (PRKA) anchor protein 1b n=1 Tax=Osmerus mordax TaxID=8014 RepID=UPI003510C5A0